MKRVLVIGDLHCGSMVGLTPPEWMVRRERDEEKHDLQESMWRQYCEIVDSIGRVDALVVNGDVIDGKGTACGGTEHVTVDMLEQTEMAIEAIGRIDFGEAYFTYGTPYHTTSKGGEDFDKVVANAFNAPIEDELNLNIEGLVVNVKHKVGSSPSSYNRANSITKQHIWDVLTSEAEKDATADILIRSHVHYYYHCEGRGWNGFCVPALQANGTKFGGRQCVGRTDCGVLLLEIDGGRMVGYGPQFIELDSQKKKMYIVSKEN